MLPLKPSHLDIKDDEREIIEAQAKFMEENKLQSSHSSISGQSSQKDNLR